MNKVAQFDIFLLQEIWVDNNLFVSEYKSFPLVEAPGEGWVSVYTNYKFQLSYIQTLYS